MIESWVVISGCSGGGKSTLLAELESRGHAVVAEPGRRIVAEECARGGSALPWVDPVAFAERAIDMALADLEDASCARLGSPSSTGGWSMPWWLSNTRRDDRACTGRRLVATLPKAGVSERADFVLTALGRG